MPQRNEVAGMEDITPALLENLKARFSEKISVNPKIRALYKKITDGQGTYVDAENYAYMIGEALAQVFQENLSSAVLPNGKLYYNIAERILGEMLGENNRIISEATEIVQNFLNKNAGLGLKAQLVAVNKKRIAGLVEKVASAETYDEVAWVLNEPVKNFSLSVVDEILRKNVEFQGEAGLTPVVIRKSRWKCCPWCADLAGEYTYPVISGDVYRRHENCRCTVEFDPKDGRKSKQNVHTKEWT